MKKIKNNIILVNSIFSFIVQILTIVSGFVIPRLILKNFGSEVNGLVSSLNQALNYIALIEGGITGVVMASLYKPLYNKDDKKVSSIVVTAQKFYNKISIFFIFYTLLLAILYPLIIKTNFSFLYISTLTLILSLQFFIQYMYSLSLKTLLNADRKVYVVSISEIIFITLNMIIFSVTINFYKNIHFLKFISGIIYLIQPVIFNIYIKKNYKIDKNVEADNKLIESRWDGFAINIAAFIHNNTDIAILTIFENLKIVSVYSVYQLVTSGLRKIISSISSSIAPSMGRLIAKGDKGELNEKFGKIEYLYFMIVYFFFSVGIVAIVPFVNLYTKGINDVNYNQPVFAIILLIAEGLYALRGPYVDLAYSANKFKEMKKIAYLEAILNIVISIILVNFLGLVGVAIGTLVAMSVRTFYQIYFLKNNILDRPLKYFLKKFIIFSTVLVFGCIMTYEITKNIYINNTIISWVGASVIVSFIFIILYLIASFVFFRDDFVFYCKYFKKNKDN